MSPTSTLNIYLFEGPIFFVKILQNKEKLSIQSRRSFCASPSCQPRLRLGLQSLGLAQKDSLLLLMILKVLESNHFSYEKKIFLVKLSVSNLKISCRFDCEFKEI
jgi:hypothetical protein